MIQRRRDIVAITSGWPVSGNGDGAASCVSTPGFRFQALKGGFHQPSVSGRDKHGDRPSVPNRKTRFCPKYIRAAPLLQPEEGVADGSLLRRGGFCCVAREQERNNRAIQPTKIQTEGSSPGRKLSNRDAGSCQAFLGAGVCAASSPKPLFPNSDGRKEMQRAGPDHVHHAKVVIRPQSFKGLVVKAGHHPPRSSYGLFLLHPWKNACGAGLFPAGLAADGFTISHARSALFIWSSDSWMKAFCSISSIQVSRSLRECDEVLSFCRMGLSAVTPAAEPFGDR